MLDVARPGPDYTLRWPRELFAQEAQTLASTAPALLRTAWADQVEWLLVEAFTVSTPATDFRQSELRSTWRDSDAAGLAKLAPYLRQPTAFLQALVDATERLPQEADPQPYYAARQGVAQVDDSPPGSALRRDWKNAIETLQWRGYFSEFAPRVCVDNVHAEEPDLLIDVEIAARLGRSGLWYLRNRDEWDDAEFFSLVEVMHDLVRRPRSRRHHDFNGCGWHFSDFVEYPARVLYRWTVNRILARHGVDLALAKSGEDAGRLVHQPADPRAALTETAAPNTGPQQAGTVEHAITLFRSRTANREDKRSACVALHRVLEQRRALLQTELLNRDEGALFRIANEFDVRHSRADQRPDYDDAYLDWLFWWYLGTVELTNRLLARQTGVGA